MQLLQGLEPQMPQLSSKNLNNDNYQKDERDIGCLQGAAYRGFIDYYKVLESRV